MRRAGIVHVHSGGGGFLPPDFHDDSLAIVHLRMTLECRVG